MSADTIQIDRREIVRLILRFKWRIRCLDILVDEAQTKLRGLERQLRLWSEMDKALKLRLGIFPLEREYQEWLALWKEHLKSRQQDVNAALRDLADCIGFYDQLHSRNHHEMAQLLGISHVALERFVERLAERDAADIADRLGSLAFMHAETAFERACERAGCIFETPSRKPILFRAMQKAVMRAIQENSAFRYRTDKIMQGIFPGFPVRAPERNFQVVSATGGQA